MRERSPGAILLSDGGDKSFSIKSPVGKSMRERSPGAILLNGGGDKSF
jgi:hypothetical protein